MGEEDGVTTGHASGDESSAQLDDKWGDDISEERQAELRALFERQKEWVTQPEASRGDSVFKGVRLTGADVSWMAEWSERDKFGNASNLHLEKVNLIGAHLEGADLSSAHLEGAHFEQAHLEGVNLMGAHLEGAQFEQAHLEGAYLAGAYLEGAILHWAHLEGAVLWGAHLEGAYLAEAQLQWGNLQEAHLERAVFRFAHLEGATLTEAHLEGADFRWAHLEGRQYVEADPQHAADLMRIRTWTSTSHKDDFPARLLPADLRRAYLDRGTDLTDTTLGNVDNGYVWVADIRWGEVNLAVVDWPERPILRDELEANEWRPTPSKPDAQRKRPARQEQRKAQQNEREARLNLYRAATRANRQLATVLRTQGLNDEADRFAYRAQVLHRTVLRMQDRRGAAVGSWLLDLVSGYGYQPLRSVATYAIVVLTFATAYFTLTNFALTPFLPSHSSPLAWYEAIVLSVSSFHGRGLFPTGLSLGDPVAILAAIEAIIGLLIEITFIATFTQRFFAR